MDLRAVASLTLPINIAQDPRLVGRSRQVVTKRGVKTVWNLRAGIKAHTMQRGLRTQLLRQETIESD
jgi:hypothetical protein